jgi:hypothetical protein
MELAALALLVLLFLESESIFVQSFAVIGVAIIIWSFVEPLLERLLSRNISP